MTTAKISGLQIFNNSVSSSAIVNFDTEVSRSAELSGFRSIPAGTVSSSTQINTGSFTGSFIGTHSGSTFGTASWANNAVSSSFATTASYVAGTAAETSAVPPALRPFYAATLGGF
jgi:hypothetical protein